MSNRKRFRMSLSLNVLNHLGIGLYSNIPAVLSEIVANSWDADATEVRIQVDTVAKAIRIFDNGVGMSERDMNEKYLKVGFDKRASDGEETAILKRPVMGRKGIGKLSVFSIANTVEVQSVKDDEPSGFIMDVAEIQQKIKDEANEGGDIDFAHIDYSYYPVELDRESISIDSGTLIVLRNLRKDIARTKSYLRLRLARRFSVIGATHKFQVFVNDDEVTAREREFFNFLEFVWYFGEESESVLERTGDRLKKGTHLDNNVDQNNLYRVTGWIATIDEQKNFKEYEDNINAIVIFARGKLVQEDILTTYKEGGIYSKYLIGELDADFLDDNDKPDIITSNRQSVHEDDDRYRLLRDFIWKQLKIVQTQWAELRKQESVSRATRNPAIKRWYSKWKGDNRKAAEKLFQRIEALPLPDREAKIEMYKANLVAFETLAMRDSLSMLDSIESMEQFDTVMRIFRDIDELEAMKYYDVVVGRICVVNQLDKMLPEALEATLRDYIYEHLWLLDPSWERAASDERIEESVTKEFDDITAKLSDAEKRARIDLRYRTAAGKHIIIELKKYDRSVDVTALGTQIGKYKRALEKCLRTHRPKEVENVECIILLGKPPRNNYGVEDINQYLLNFKSRYILYDALIEDTLRNYKDYLAAQDEVATFRKLLEEFAKDMSP